MKGGKRIWRMFTQLGTKERSSLIKDMDMNIE